MESFPKAFPDEIPDGVPTEYTPDVLKTIKTAMPHVPNVVLFGPKSNCTLELCPITWSVYKYRPSLPANAIFLVLFALAMGVHIYLGVRWKSWWFMAFMIAGCLSEIIGYAGRIVMYNNPFSFSAFMVQIIMITGAPVYFTAAIYVTLSKTIEHFSIDLSRIRPSLYYYIFIPADLVCLVLQAVGGAFSVVSQGVSQKGIDLAMAGLIMQVIVIAAFVFLFADYMLRYFRSNKTRELLLREKLFFWFLGLAIVLILGRCGYRCYELSEGYKDSALITDEGLFIGLEGVLIFISALALCIGHPGFIFHGKGAARPVNETSRVFQVPDKQTPAGSV